ncbi:peptidoglycan-binding protein [Xinfangfangia sp. CPCC 101601]|uniref:Peptidoglycan-binding protein n=1 Tax=Pseudogemmobacter lacusdianii TaxID=3069608 RepID=A0ABU0W0N0_9RHOB|nr:peptidoglycan-binding protein [Xinfangfangia sp. CPCC 101601]MDQ2066970.1 peptidoglycan-binding protein [Xinfangfangia sp. CPCC 101601]
MRNNTLAAVLCAGMAISASPITAQNLGGVVEDLAKSLLNQEMERNAYEQARATNTAQGWRNFLAQYPNGVYRAQAERALDRFGSSTKPKPVDPVDPGYNGSAASVEAALGLSREQRRLIQRQLTSLGYNAGAADGLWGRGTRAAIASWQKAGGYEATGYVTSRQVGLLRQQAGNVAPPVEDTATNDQLEERLLGLTRAERQIVQRSLTALGYSTRGTDGIFGANTRRALASWQRDEGLASTGYINADQLRTLRTQAGY